MEFEIYLKIHQKILYQTFLNAKKSNSLSHAYLIKGDSKTPILKTAKFLAKSLLCDENGFFACNNCLTCHRFDDNNYADFVLLNAQKDNLKVADIEALTQKFSKTPLEEKGKMIYIIHHVENMNRESINALLKFLEEPNENIYAFLTTANESKVLPTILSRCQHLKMLPYAQNKVIENALKLDITSLDAELISNFATEDESILEIAQDESYQLVKNIFLNYIKELSTSLESGYYYLQKVAIVNIRTKEQIRLFIDMISYAFKEMMNLKLELCISLHELKSYLEMIAVKIKNLQYCYREIMITRSRIELNVTISLIIEHLGYIILKGEE